MKNNSITSEERDEYIDMLREAQNKLYEALETMRYVQRATENNYAYTYIIAPIAIATSNEHEWVSGDPSIDDWIEDLEEMECEDSEEGEEGEEE